MACLSAGALTASAVAVVAQGSAAPDPAVATSAARPSPWEVEVHGGLSMNRDQTSGIATLPTTGTTVQGLVSLNTMAFGAGTALFNSNRPSTPIVGLDGILSASPVTRNAGAALGGRVQRALNDRLAIEVSGDFLRGRLAFRPTVLSGIESTRASYATALERTLALSDEVSSASSVATIADRQLATRVVATGALVRHWRRSGRTMPYVLAGGGVMFNHANALEATVAGTYRLGITSYVTGVDTVRVHVQEDSKAIVALGGVGVKHAMSRHTGFRVDARVHAYRNSLRTVVDVTPTMAAQSLGPTLPLLNVDMLQFSAIAPLSQPSLSAVTFAGSGLNVHTSVTAGLFLRF
jgi:hypothetical protein